MWDVFASNYLVDHQVDPAVTLAGYTIGTVEGKVEIDARVGRGGEPVALTAVGNGPIDAYVNALQSVGVGVRVLDYYEHALSSGGDAQAAAYVIRAVTSAVNHAHHRGRRDPRRTDRHA